MIIQTPAKPHPSNLAPATNKPSLLSTWNVVDGKLVCEWLKR